MRPAAVGGEAADTVADLVIGDVRPDRGHHADEIDAQLRQAAVEAGVSAERDQHVGEVDAGRGDRDLDLSGPGRNTVERDEFHRLQVTGGADLQPHAVAFVVDDGGVPLVGAQRTRAQARRVPLRRCARRSRPPPSRPAVRWASCSASVCSSTSIWVVRRCGCSAPITRSRPRSPACSRLSSSSGQHDLRVPGHDVQARQFTREFGQLAGDAHQMTHLLTAPAADSARPGCRRVAGRGRPRRRQPGTRGDCASRSALAAVVSFLRPVEVVAFRALGFQRIGQRWWPAGPRRRRC